MAQSLDKIFKQIEKDSWDIGKEAMMNAANQAMVLIAKEAKKCLQDYLAKKPKIYERINPSPLAKTARAISPKQEIHGNKYIIMFGVRYDPSKIEKKYKSSSWYHESGKTWVSRFDQNGSFKKDSQSNGIPGSKWILDNYLQGIHPGYDRYGENHGWVDATSPQETMRKLIEEELPKKAGGLIYQAMHGAITDFIKTNGGGR